MPVSWALLFVLLAGCMASNYGRLQWRNSLTDTFQSAQLLPHHRYFYSGPDFKPWAVIAIHNDYQLKTQFWKDAELDSEKLRMWIGNMRMDFGIAYMFNGADIVGPNKEEIGIWYSFQETTMVRLYADNTVTVKPPNVHGWDSKIKRYFEMSQTGPPSMVIPAEKPG